MVISAYAHSGGGGDWGSRGFPGQRELRRVPTKSIMKLALEILRGLARVHTLGRFRRVGVAIDVQVAFADAVMRLHRVVYRVGHLLMELPRADVRSVLKAQAARGEGLVQNRKDDLVRLRGYFAHQESVLPGDGLRL